MAIGIAERCRRRAARAEKKLKQEHAKVMKLAARAARKKSKGSQRYYRRKERLAMQKRKKTVFPDVAAGPINWG